MARLGTKPSKRFSATPHLKRARGNSFRSDRNLSTMKKFHSSSGKSRTPVIKLKLNASNKRKNAPSVTSDSSAGEDLNDDDEEEDNDDSDDSDEDMPEIFAPSYGGSKKRSNRKAGRRSARPLFQGRKKLKLVQDDDQFDTRSVSSVSSVSPLSHNGSESEDDDGYEGVDEVSDGDEEEQMMEAFEEQSILQSEYERNRGVGDLNASSDVWMGLDDLEHRPLYSAGSFFDNEHLGDEHLLMDPASTVVTEPSLNSEPVDTSAHRSVRFENAGDTSDSDKTSDDELLPDFLYQDRLDPDLRRLIENDIETMNRGRSPQNLFINSDFCDLPDNIYHVDDTDASVGSLSGYETDDGETTDEEDYPPPATITHPRSILRRESSVSLSPESAEQTSTSQPLIRRGPLRGTFVADPHKPVAVVAPNGRQLILIPPYASSRHDWLESAANSLTNTANNSPKTTTMNILDDSDTDAISPSRPGFSPMLSSNANLMMTALGNDAAGQVMGPPEAFYPTTGFSAENSFDEEEDSEALLNVDDFVDFGHDSSDDEMAKELDDMDEFTSPAGPSTMMDSVTPTPNRTAMEPPQASSAERLLNHLDQGIVTAFRRNHNRYQALIRLPHHREFLPANSPSRPASVFKRSKMANPRTPTRTREGSHVGSEAVRRKVMDSHQRNSIAL